MRQNGIHSDLTDGEAAGDDLARAKLLEVMPDINRRQSLAIWAMEMHIPLDRPEI